MQWTFPEDARRRPRGVTAAFRSPFRKALLAAAMLLAAGPAHAGSWRLNPGDSGPSLVFGADDAEEDVSFIAQCGKGRIEVTYPAPDRASIKAGEEKACDGLRPCREKLPATLLVDGKATEVVATAQPEEMYGGYEIHFALDPRAPFWASVKTGQSLSLKIDGAAGERLPLKGSKLPVTSFLAACGK
ncbi:hypothetical protein V5F59_14975 [Xanthobacter autotrophicus DSM 431]|uniref:hypothetical protein n=1 Tax=Xanthobacter nonsaccharivorans TaxID=3119912 RepID=UPI00372B6A03